MIETWRWFGPTDKVTLNDIRQTGASGIVTSLIIWNRECLKKEEISSSWQKSLDQKSPDQLIMERVESLPVSEVIKTGSHLEMST